MAAVRRATMIGLTAAAAVISACGGSTSLSSVPSTSTGASSSTASVSTVTRTVTVTAAPTIPPAATPVATASTPTAAEVEAVARRIFPSDGSGGFGECDRGDDLSACPVTPRLSARLLEHPTSGSGGGAAPFCRCQATSSDLTVTVDAISPGLAHVALFSGSDRIDLSVIRSGGQLLVDDTTCTGKDAATTSIYAASVPACGG